MNLKEIVGKTISEIEGANELSELVTLYFSDGTACQIEHMQDCCESVQIDIIEGDASDVIGSVVIEASEDNDEPEGEMIRDYNESHTWKNYTIRTDKGTFVMRWLGESNGYYSETPNLRITHGKEV